MECRDILNVKTPCLRKNTKGNDCKGTRTTTGPIKYASDKVWYIPIDLGQKFSNPNDLIYFPRTINVIAFDFNIYSF